MKLYIAFLLFLVFAAFASAVDRPTASLPAASAGIVCAMSLCPTATLSKRDLSCPKHCKDDCQIIDDQCCPGVQKAVCNNNSSSAGAESSVTAVPNASSSLLATSSIPASSSLLSTSSAQPSQSTVNNTPNSAESNRIAWSFVLIVTILSFIINAAFF